jgi:glycosyltransferase involved in cell wall biosynthesis
VILLELCLSPDFGGLEIFFRDYARWLANRSDVTQFLCVRSGSRLASELKPLGLPTLEFASKGGALPVTMARRLARFIDEHQIEALHLHWKDDLPTVALAKSLARRKLRVIHSRHMDLPGPKHDPYHWLMYRSIDTYHTITKAVAVQAMAYLPIPRARVKHVYLGATLEAPALVESRAALRAKLGLADTFTVGVVGRISEYKGQHLLVDALWQLSDRGVSVQGVIAGHAMEPDYLESLKARVNEAGLSGRVHFLGFQEDPHALIRALDVLVLTTEKETFGLVLVEAMLLGVPVIGSDAGGVPEIIQHGRSGLLFDSGDSTKLANAIEALHHDPALRTELAQAGQARAQSEFHRDTQYAKLLELLQG